jgi:hypothetical protein
MTNLFANQIGYSDITPHEVIRVVSDKCLEIRSMNYAHTNAEELVFHVGGFSAHCSNQNDQKWDITSDANGYVLKIRKSKSGVWKDKNGDTYAVEAKARRRYDFNF